MTRPARKHRKARESDPPTPHPRRRIAVWLVVVLLLAAGAWGFWHRLSAGLLGPSQPPGPNVLLISIDQLRPDHLSAYGYFRKTSPRIDQVATEGILFEDHISSTSWTLPAHAALFTSLPDSVHGCTDTDKRLSDKLVTLAAQFAKAGYQTAGFFSGPYLHPAFGLGHGFEHYEDCTSCAEVLANNSVGQWAMSKSVMDQSHEDITNPRLHAAFKRWLDGHRGKRFFMFVHMWDPHFDFIPPPPYDTMWDPSYTGTIDGRNYFYNERVAPQMPERDLEHIKALYDGEITWTDFYVGKILDELRQAGLLDNTVVAITSDHGTEFLEHGQRTHRLTVFDEVIRVPLIIRYPPSLKAGSRVHEQTRIIDIGPTLLDLAGVAPMAGVMGHSLVPLMHGEPLDFDNTAVSELLWAQRQMRAIRTPEWKFIDLWKVGKTVMDPPKRWYMELARDPGEQQPQWDLSQGLGAQLLARYEQTVELLDRWRQEIASPVGQSNVSKDLLRTLESFGYVGGHTPPMSTSTSVPASQPTSAPASQPGP